MDPIPLGEKTFFTVVIPTFRRNELLSQCLDHVAPGAQTLSADRYEVIVSDDAADRATEAMVQEKYPWAKWVTGTQRGPAANRNNGARHAQGDWLVFTDDDCLPDSGWLEAFSNEVLRHPAVEVIEGRTYADRPRKHFLEESPINDTGGNLWSCNFAIKRTVFIEMHGFNERFPFAAMEDKELNYRLKQRPTRMVYITEASVMHPWRMTRNWWVHFRRNMKSRLILEELHPGQGFPDPWWRILLGVIRLNVRRLLPDLCHYRWDLVRMLPTFWRANLLEMYLAWRCPPSDRFIV